MRVCSIAAKEAGVSLFFAYRKMPAKLVFALEHCYWTDQGYDCVRAVMGSLEDELAELMNVAQ